jgi:hypothetical protein
MYAAAAELTDSVAFVPVVVEPEVSPAWRERAGG